MYKIIVQYVVIMSVVTFIVFGADKGLAKAQEKRKRSNESVKIHWCYYRW